MTTPNTQGDSPEVKNVPKESSNKTIKTLLDIAIKNICIRNWSFDPEVLKLINNSAKRDGIIEEVKVEMENIKNSDDEYAHIDSQQINSYLSSDIRVKIEKEARGLRNIQKNAKQYIKKVFPNIPANFGRAIEEALKNYNESELQSIIASPKTLRRHLLESHHITPAELVVWTPKFKEIFDYDNLSDGNLKDTISKAINDYENGNILIDRTLIQELVWYYGNNSIQILKICRAFSLTFTIQESKRLGLLTGGQIQKIVAQEYSDIWNDLTPDQRKELENFLQNDDSLSLTIDDIKNVNIDIENLFSDPEIQNRLATKIRGNIEDLSEWKEKIPVTLAHLIEYFEGKWDEKNARIAEQLKQFSSGNILTFSDKKGDPIFYKILDIDQEMNILDWVGWAVLASINWYDSKSIGTQKWAKTISYQTIKELLIKYPDFQVFTESDLKAQIEGGFFTDSEWNIIENKEKEENILTEEYLKSEIDKIDPSGKDIPLVIWTVFVADAEADNGTKIQWQSFTITDIQPPEIFISNWKGTESASFEEFVALAKTNNFSRLALLSNDADFLKALEPFGVPAWTKLKDNMLISESEIDDGHGHKETKEVPYEYFKDEEGGHMRITGIDTDHVMVWEWSGHQDLEKVKKLKDNKKLSKKEEASCYYGFTLTRWQFLAYLKKNKFKATREHILDENATNIYHPHDPHMHGSFFGALSKGISINDIVKWFWNIVHGWEHYFEKNSKLNASRFALKMGRNFGFPADIMAQLQADEVWSVKEIIEKIQEKFSNLNGPVARNKALHIAQLTSSSPEEVGAAMLYMVKWYGHLYAEDIAHAQWSESFINGFLYSLGWTSNEEISAMKVEARWKFMADLWSGGDGWAPTEEEMIWWLLKIFDWRSGLSKSDSKYDPRYANAGTVTKAMWGPSGWEKSWRTEWIENAFQKWIRQWAAVVNAQGRINKWLSAFKTHELNTAVGFMEKAAGKAPDPVIQILPVVWALGGYSKYSSTEMLQRVKGYGDSKWHTFHAFSFLRNETDNDTYMNLFLDALRDMDPSEASVAKHQIDILRKGPIDKSKDKKWADAHEASIDYIAKMWKKYCDAWLHDRLQGKNTWLIKQVKSGNLNAKKYADRLASIHMMNGDATSPSDDNAWWLQHGYNGSPMFGSDIDGKSTTFKKKDGVQVYGLDRTLKKLQIDGGWYDFVSNSKDRLWPSILARFDALKNETDEDLKKAQYTQYRNDMIEYFRNKMRISTRWADGAINEIKRKTYYPDLLKMGIDVADFFTTQKLTLNENRDYGKWKNQNNLSWSHSTYDIQDHVTSLVWDTVNGVVA